MMLRSLSRLPQMLMSSFDLLGVLVEHVDQLWNGLQPQAATGTEAGTSRCVLQPRQCCSDFGCPMQRNT
jgi:hypothetical protein